MVILFLLCLAVLIGVCAGGTAQTHRSSSTGTMRCPSCGAQATVRGNSWECGWCGDCGVFR